MADRVLLSNDTVTGGNGGINGLAYDDQLFRFGLDNETSVHGVSAATVAVFVAPQNGKIVDFFIGTVKQGVSASGWVSGTVTADVRINSVTALTTSPAIPMAGSAGAVARKATNAGGGTSAVVDTAANTFSAGDQICIDYNLRSVGSAAATAAGVGFYGGILVRYAAQ